MSARILHQIGLKGGGLSGEGTNGRRGSKDLQSLNKPLSRGGRRSGSVPGSRAGWEIRGPGGTARSGAVLMQLQNWDAHRRSASLSSWLRVARSSSWMSWTTQQEQPSPQPQGLFGNGGRTHHPVPETRRARETRILRIISLRSRHVFSSAPPVRTLSNLWVRWLRQYATRGDAF